MTKPDDSESILYAFAVEENHDRTTLERYLKEYPDLAEELIDLSSELRLSEALGPAPATQDPGFDAAWERFLAIKPRENVREVKVINPFALFRGEAFVSLAETLNVPRSFLIAFRDGLVAAVSIPRRFIRRFAEATNSSVETVREFFDNARPAPVARAFKADGKPAHQGQRTFRELIESTEMSEEQRQLLLEDCSDDGLD